MQARDDCAQAEQRSATASAFFAIENMYGRRHRRAYVQCLHDYEQVDELLLSGTRINWVTAHVLHERVSSDEHHDMTV